MKHFGNPKNENLLRGPKFYGENEFLVEMCIFSTKKIEKKNFSTKKLKKNFFCIMQDIINI